MANPFQSTIALTAAVANGISASQSVGSAGPLTINGSLATGGVATLTSANCKARRVGITSAGNDSGITFTITGASRNGDAHSETLTGGNATTVQSVKDYATVTRIAASGATASTVTAGTTTVGSNVWEVLDQFQNPFSVGVFVTIFGTANVTVEYTPDDPNAAQAGSIAPGSFTPPNPWPTSQLAGLSASAASGLTFPVFAIRLTVNSGTGTATMQYIQSGPR